MTIHADFIKILKEGNKQAFSDTLPHKPDLVFIDGQVKLMKADSIQTWPLFLKVQFYSTIERAFFWGAQTVVLAFDNYSYVPASKTMTQVKRNKHVPVFKFAHAEELPTFMPTDWNSAMRNRTFKVKVIEKILRETKLWFTAKQESDVLYKDKTLIFDFHGIPDVINCVQNDVISNFVASRAWNKIDVPDSVNDVGRGECDIKAFTWMAISNILLIVSTDGDYVPLGLLQMLKQCEKINGNSWESSCCQIILHRMTTQVNTCGKRAFEDSKSQGEQTRKKRTYEFVFLPLVAAFIQEHFPSTMQHPIKQFCTLVACCGCDFALNLPRLGPRTLWKFAHNLEHLNLCEKEELMYALIILYANVFKQNNTSTLKKSSISFNLSSEEVVKTYENTMNRIKAGTQISSKIKDQLWQCDRAWAHSKNTAWTFKYWNQLDECPLPHTEDFGYVIDDHNRTHFAAL